MVEGFVFSAKAEEPLLVVCDVISLLAAREQSLL